MKSSDLTAWHDLENILKSKIKGKVVIAGIGNIMRGDDGLAPKLIEMLKAKDVKASLFDCGTAPENYIFPMLTTGCETVVLVDAADIGLPAGGVKIFDIDKISNVSFSTHNPSPRLFTDLLKTGRDNINIFVVCMQPSSTRFGENLSKEVLAGLEGLAELFSKTLI